MSERGGGWRRQTYPPAGTRGICWTHRASHAFPYILYSIINPQFPICHPGCFCVDFAFMSFKTFPLSAVWLSFLLLFHIYLSLSLLPPSPSISRPAFASSRSKDEEQELQLGTEPPSLHPSLPWKHVIIYKYLISWFFLGFLSWGHCTHYFTHRLFNTACVCVYFFFLFSFFPDLFGFCGGYTSMETGKKGPQGHQHLTIFYNGRVCACEVTEVQVWIYI